MLTRAYCEAKPTLSSVYVKRCVQDHSSRLPISQRPSQSQSQGKKEKQNKNKKIKQGRNKETKKREGKRVKRGSEKS